MTQRLKIQLDIAADGSVAVREIGRADRALDDFGRSADAASSDLARLKGLAAGVFTAGLAAQIMSFSRATVGWADTLSDLADRIGLTVGDIQTLRQQAELFGVSAEEADSGLEKFSVGIAKARQGIGPLAKDLAAYNIALSDDQGLRSTSAVLDDYINLLSRMSDGNERNRLATDAFGKSNVAFGQVLESLNGSLSQTQEELLQTGRIMSGDLVDAAAVLDDRWATLMQRVDMLAKNAVASVLESFFKLSDYLASANSPLRLLLTEAERAKFDAAAGGYRTGGTLDDRAQTPIDPRPIAGASEGILKGVNAKLAQRFRSMVADAAKVGIDLQASSGRRTPEENSRVGGSPTSNHLDGNAIDIRTRNLNREAIAWIKANAGKYEIVFPVRFESPDKYTDHLHAELAKAEQATRGRSTGQRVARESAARQAAAQREVNDVVARYRDLVVEVQTPQEKFNAQIRELNELRAQFEQRGFAFDPAIYARGVEQARAEFDSAKEGASEGLKEINETAAQLGMTFSSAFEEAVIGGGKLRDVLQGLAQDMLRIFARKAVTEPLTRIISGGIGALMGSIFHSGGIVGATSAPSRALPAMAWAGAPRLHGGLAPDEIPAILQRGERVSSRAQVAAEGKAVQVNVMVKPLPGSSARVEQSGNNLTIEMVEAYVANAFVRGGNPIARSAETAYPGLRRGR